MRVCNCIFTAVLLLISLTTYSANQLFLLESKGVKIVGTFTRKTYPGPPNYENIQAGDKAETGNYLILKKPIDVADKPEDISPEYVFWRKNVLLIQLIILEDKLYEQLKQGQRMRLTGELIAWQTGHHHTPVLMEVKKIEAL